jgi:hypothetical protein
MAGVGDRLLGLAQKDGALPFSRPLREVGAFRGLSVTAKFVEFLLQVTQGVFARHSGSSHQKVIRFPCLGTEEIPANSLAASGTTLPGKKVRSRLNLFGQSIVVSSLACIR